MHQFAAAGGSFLLAVLWFDLMFDVQTRNHADATLPPAVLTSIASYYRRVTTDARPMNRLIALVMILTLAALIGEIVEARNPAWLEWTSLLCAAGAIDLAAGRMVANAVALGGGKGTLVAQSRLARTIYRDHLICFTSMIVLTGLQLAAR